MSFSIVRSHPDLLKYVESLQAKNSNALGFLPRVVFEKAAEAGQIFLGLLGGEPAGYILAGTGFYGVMHCVQVCIQYDARRRLYGAMLVAAVEEYGEERGCSRISLRCGSDLPANEFWQSLGYTLESTEESGEGRKYVRRCINVWSKPLFPAVVATAWKNGRPRIYGSNAERQVAYDTKWQNWLARSEGVASGSGQTGRPRIYASNAMRQAAYRLRRAAYGHVDVTEEPFRNRNITVVCEDVTQEPFRNTNVAVEGVDRDYPRISPPSGRPTA